MDSPPNWTCASPYSDHESPVFSKDRQGYGNDSDQYANTFAFMGSTASSYKAEAPPAPQTGSEPTAAPTPLSSTQSDMPIHYLPCNIDYDGPAPVSSYFIVKSSDNNDGEVHASLRGRQLVGVAVQLPQNVHGVCAITSKSAAGQHLEQSHLQQQQEQRRRGLSLEPVGSFSSITMWQHDVKPDTGVLQDCFDWLSVAQAVSDCHNHMQTVCKGL